MRTKITAVRKLSNGRMAPVQSNEQLHHPYARHDNGVPSFSYKFLRVVRHPLPGRPDSGRILVNNESTNQRQEFYALLFGVSFERI